MSRIVIITPAPRNSRTGNRVTANRWAKILRSLNHCVIVAEKYDNQRCDLMIALHAKKNARAIHEFATHCPQKPLVVALTGTDLYRDLNTSDNAQRSLRLATLLVLLQPDGINRVPRQYQNKIRVIYQSAKRPMQAGKPLQKTFEICVSGHLRAVKDPLRAAMAARHLPVDSKIRITHIGAARTESFEQRARKEMLRNHRYRWLGEVSRTKSLQLLRRSRLLVLTSKMEGGANVISEAIVAGVPVVSSRISGSLGILGPDYPGYFPVGDTLTLERLMYRCETDTGFYQTIKSWCHKRTPLLQPKRETAAWAELIEEVQQISRGALG